MKEKVVSVIISERDEGHNNAFTIQSIVNDLETFLSPDEWEIILVENCTKDDSSWRFLAERGMYYHRNVRILHDPIAGNVTARNKGVKIAKGKWVFFSDAHMSYKIGSFKAMIETLKTYGGIVHPAVQWLGGYFPSDPSYQYTIKLGEKVWGTWNRCMVSATLPFYIPVCGHCCLGVNRQEFLALGGYNNYFRCYGGGELYLDLKWWMLGKSVMSVPTAVGYHLSAGRGYSFKQDDLIHNMMLMSLALGAPAMAERIYIRYLNKKGVDKSKLDRMFADAKKESSLDSAVRLVKEGSQFPEGSRTRSFYDVICERPWDSLNLKLHGVKASLIGVYDSSWTGELEGDALAMFNASPLQVELGKLIRERLAEYVYKGGAE